MPWVRIDEEFPHHPKVAPVGPLGVALQVAALCYCNRYLTDGYIRSNAVRTLLDFTDLGEYIDGAWVKVGPLDVAQRLVDVGMWERVAGGFLIHDYEIYQPSRANVEAERKKTRDRVAKYRASNKGRNKKRNGVTPDVGNGASTPPPVPVPPSLPSLTAVPSFTGVGDMPVDNPVNNSGREGKGRPPRTPRHPTDDYVIRRARQIQAESGVEAAKAYIRTVGKNYGQATREDQLRRLEAIMAQDQAEAGEP